jgi:hypothetical protein
MKRRGSWLFDMACAVAVSGCGPELQPEPVSEDEARSRYVVTVCDALRACDCAFPGQAAWDDCEADLDAAFASWQANARQDSADFDPACLQAHLQEREGDLCASTEDCLIYHGAGEKGEPCVNFDPGGHFSSCQAGLRCPNFLGFCVPRGAVTDYDPDGLLPVNEQCLDEELDIVGLCDYPGGLYCDIEAAVPTCHPLAEIGGACAFDVACGGDGFCERGLCSPEKPDGELCTRREECESFTCDAGRCAASLTVPDGCAYLIP